MNLNYDANKKEDGSHTFHNIALFKHPHRILNFNVLMKDTVTQLSVLCVLGQLKHIACVISFEVEHGDSEGDNLRGQFRLCKMIKSIFCFWLDLPKTFRKLLSSLNLKHADSNDDGGGDDHKML